MVTTSGSTMFKAMMTACAVGAALWISSVGAAEAPGARPGDEALTCEQIYAQGMAESQRDQEERRKRIEQQKAQTGATAALLTGAMMTGGLSGTGLAAQRAAEAQADQQMAMLGTPQTNPRMESLKQLWAQKHCVRK
jgi:hypothetical protein